MLSTSASPDNLLETTCGSIFFLSHCISCPHGDAVQVWSLQAHPVLLLGIDPTHPRPGFLRSTIYSHLTPVRTTSVPSFSCQRPWFLTYICSVRASGSRKVSATASHSHRTNLPPNDSLVSAPNPSPASPCLCGESPSCSLLPRLSWFVVNSVRTT